MYIILYENYDLNEAIDQSITGGFKFLEFSAIPVKITFSEYRYCCFIYE